VSRLPYLFPWLRVELLLRSILTTRWDEATQLPRMLAMRAQASKNGWWN